MSDISIETDENGIVSLETCKYCWAITDIEKKAIRDYYFDLANNKSVYKHI